MECSIVDHLGVNHLQVLTRLSVLSLSLTSLVLCFAPQSKSAQLESKVSCPPIDIAGLSKLVHDHPNKSLRLVFFSSWCSDCAVHLKKINQSNDVIVIGTFDKRPRIEKAISRLNLSQKCFTDAGVGKHLNVTVVPSDRTVSAETLRAVSEMGL